jgi:hypothetical protein
MPDAAVRHPVLELRRREGAVRLLLDPGLELGAGGEARVLGLPGDPLLVAKLYHRPEPYRARKLALMLGHLPAPAEGASLAWPLELLSTPEGRFAGFLMPRAEGPRIFELYNPTARRRIVPLFDWARLHRVGMNLAAAFAGVHAAGYVIGDVNESNFVVAPDEATVALVDTDSFQVRDPATGDIYRSAVGKAEFTPPELQGARFDLLDRTAQQDAFGLGVLLFLLLMEGTHPFAVRIGEGTALAVEERIRHGLFPWAPGAAQRPPRLAPSFELLHPELRDLFVRCFAAGHRDPAARPRADEWGVALARAELALAECLENPRHRYGAHLEQCPWCHRRSLLGGRDPFPASVALAREADAAPPPRTVARPAAAAPFLVPASPYATPSVPRLFGPPGPLTLPVYAFVQGVAAGLPGWVSGPSALGSPLPWAVPGVFAVLAGGGVIRTMGMVIIFLILRRIFRAGAGPAGGVTVLWAMLMAFLCATLVTISSAAPRADAGALPSLPVAQSSAGPASVTPPPPVSSPVSVRDQTASGEPIVALDQVDVPPALIDPAFISEQLRALAAVTRVDGPQTAMLRLVINSHGKVEDYEVLSASSPSMLNAASKVAADLRFVPALRNGVTVATRIDTPLQSNP